MGSPQDLPDDTGNVGYLLLPAHADGDLLDPGRIASGRKPPESRRQGNVDVLVDRAKIDRRHLALAHHSWLHYSDHDEPLLADPNLRAQGLLRSEELVLDVGSQDADGLRVHEIEVADEATGTEGRIGHPRVLGSRPDHLTGLLMASQAHLRVDVLQRSDRNQCR